MKQVRTVHDATKERWAMDAAMDRRHARADARAAAKAAEQARHAAVLAAEPRIGRLVRKGQTVYYTNVDGMYQERLDPQPLADDLRYFDRVRELEAEGMTTSDAQAVADHELGM